MRFMLKRALEGGLAGDGGRVVAESPAAVARHDSHRSHAVIYRSGEFLTDLSEGMDVQHLGTFMNRYLGAMSDQVFAQDGTLDKYIGDAVMAFWNAPLPQEDHAVRACRAALQMVAREKELRAQFAAERGQGEVPPKLFTRIGINTATVAVGFIGSEHLFNYTALGDGVNLASRLEGANKLYGTRILLSANTAGAGEGGFLAAESGCAAREGEKRADGGV